MSESSNESRRWAHAHHDSFAHVVTMPGWHKAVMILGAVLTAAGAIGVLAAKSSRGNLAACVVWHHQSRLVGFSVGSAALDAGDELAPGAHVAIHGFRDSSSALFDRRRSWSVPGLPPKVIAS